MHSQVRILVVDPDDQAAELCAQVFTSQGWVVDRARGLKDASRMIKRTFYNVIIVEVMLSDALGLDAWRHFRRVLPNAIGIVTTASPTLYHSVDVFEEGVVAFLLKPLQKRALLGLAGKSVGRIPWTGSTRERAQELDRLAVFVSDIAATTTPHEIVDVALVRLQELCRPYGLATYLSRSGHLTWIDDDTRPPLAGRDWSKAQRNYVERWMLRAVQSRECQVIGGADETRIGSGTLQRVGLKALVVTPLVVRNRSYGALAVVSVRENVKEMRPTQVKLVCIIGHVTALALCNVRIAKRLPPDVKLPGSVRGSRTRP